jgi:oligopeptide transport system substrate-binding protein
MSRRAVAGAAVAALAMTGLAACGSDEADTAEGGTLLFGNCAPQNPLVPANTNEVCGGVVVDSLFTGLVNYDPETAQPNNAVASSIESDDNQNWTITLNEGYTFHDGTPVTAESFVDAWNWASFGPNAAANGYFFSYIEGWDVLNPADPDDDPETDNTPAPKAETLSGLKATDDTTITVKLVQPQSSFPLQLGYTAFSPLPESFYEDPEAFGEKPVGNGPFQFESGNPETGFVLTKFADYTGPDKPVIDGVDFKVYTDPATQYNDLLAGTIDFVEQVPPTALIDNQYQSDLGEGRWVDKAVGIIQTATLPIYQDEYKDDVALARALSLAIDRELIVEKVYNNGRTPATGWVAPVVNGYEAGACGEWCTFDADKAKEQFADAKFKGPFSYAYNADGPGNKEAAEAICNSIKNTLDVECTPKPFQKFGAFRDAIGAREMTGPFRTGWQMDWPGMDNFLEPLYVTGASANDNDYSNPEFDKLIREGAALKGDEANAKYREAEKLLADDMSVIPLWYQSQQSGWSDRITDVQVTPFGTLDLTTVAFKG